MLRKVYQANKLVLSLRPWANVNSIENQSNHSELLVSSKERKHMAYLHSPCSVPGTVWGFSSVVTRLILIIIVFFGYNYHLHVIDAERQRGEVTLPASK